MIGNHLEPFKFWCQKVLPNVYDDSLSYYEYLCKMNDYLNDVIEQINTLTDNMSDYETDLTTQWTTYRDELSAQWQTYKTYIDTYFDNLDVQQEINNKLDQMATDGTLDTLIQPYVNSEIASQVTDWLNENVDPVGSAIMIDNTLTISGAAADAKLTGDIRDRVDYYIANSAIYCDEWKRGTIYNTGWDNNNSYARTDPIMIGNNKLELTVTLTDTSFKWKTINVKQVNGVWTFVNDTVWKTTSGTNIISNAYDPSATHFIVVLRINSYSGDIWDGNTPLVDFNDYVNAIVNVTDNEVVSLQTRMSTAENDIDNLEIATNIINKSEFKESTLYEDLDVSTLVSDSLEWTATSTSTWRTASYLPLEVSAVKGDMLVIGAMYMDSLSNQILHVYEYDSSDTQLKSTIVPKSVLLNKDNKVRPYQYIVENENTSKVTARFGIRYNAQDPGLPDVVVGQTYYIRNAYVLNKRASYYRQNEFLFDLPTNWANKVETLKIAKGKKFSFCIQTDIHLRMRNPYDAPVSLYNEWETFCRNLSKLSYDVGFDFVANLGDIIRGYDTAGIDDVVHMREAYDTVMNRYQQYIKCPLFITLGNHDNNNMYATSTGDSTQLIPVAEQWARVILPASNTMHNPVFNGRSTYYYQDFDDSGIRVVVLDTCGESMFTISQTQADWFSTTALNTNKAIIVMTHVPLVDEVHTDVDVIANRDLIINALKSFKTNGGTVIGCFYGHTHAQESATVDGILHVCFNDGGDIAEAVMIDTSAKTIDTITFGFSGNRSFTYT